MKFLKFFFLPIITAFIISCSVRNKENIVTTETLIEEMVDMHRLTMFPSVNYRTIQYSSYDRRSKSPSDSCWFSNEDGFGSEPIPGFESVLKEPDSTGIGEYLICNVNKPGAIVRLWSANINGRIRLFLDNSETPAYDGNAEDFFWKTAEVLTGNDKNYAAILRQFDATYFPVPFSKSCRIEWIGDITKIHFYHVGLRIYNEDVRIRTFRKDDLAEIDESLEKINLAFTDPARLITDNLQVRSFDFAVNPGQRKTVYAEDGPGAIREFSLKFLTSDPESALRKNVLSIWFDDSSVPQIHAPVGDFFGTAPGLNPYSSLPFSINSDGVMICRFVMPYCRSVKIVIENQSGEESRAVAEVKASGYEWIAGRSMHLIARWKIDHGLTAGFFYPKTFNVYDIPYLVASGKGRIVGAAAFLGNPSNATTSWGNWWGEGDEKIFIDDDEFPSFFGTGSEDYFNYSWSSSRIFSYPYCGQPRNDGPGNRGYVSNYRFHINDDIPFSNLAAFYMELGHHGMVKDFTYGRIVYYYALPGSIDDFSRISSDDTRDIEYPVWNPIAYLGSARFQYYQAEELLLKGSSAKTEKCRLSAGGDILIWKPTDRYDRLKFSINCDKDYEKAILGFTFRHMPGGGKVSLLLNGIRIKADGKDEIDLYEPVQTLLVNHFTGKINMQKGTNTVELVSENANGKSIIGLDFIWMKKE